MEKSVFTSEYDLLKTLLRETRKRLGVTQEELAERLGETQSFVSKCERGERRLDLVQLQWFCRALGIPLTEFVEEFARRSARSGQPRSRGKQTPSSRKASPE